MKLKYRILNFLERRELARFFRWKKRGKVVFVGCGPMFGTNTWHDDTRAWSDSFMRRIRP